MYTCTLAHTRVTVKGCERSPEQRQLKLNHAW